MGHVVYIFIVALFLFDVAKFAENSALPNTTGMGFLYPVCGRFFLAENGKLKAESGDWKTHLILKYCSHNPTFCLLFL